MPTAIKPAAVRKSRAKPAATARNESSAHYAATTRTAPPATDQSCDSSGLFSGIPHDALIARAMTLLDQKYNKAGAQLSNPRDCGDFLRARLRHLPYEVFACLWLDNRHRFLSFDEMFRGTVDGATVHPREVVKEGLRHNACAVIFAHNHPSGVAEPSAADRAITHELRDALQLVGVRVLDHLVIGQGEPVSMAARGLI